MTLSNLPYSHRVPSSQFSLLAFSPPPFFCFGTLSLVNVDCMNTNELFTGTWATYQWIHHWRTWYSFSWEPLTARHSSGRAGPHEPLPHLRWSVDSSIFCWSFTGSSCYESHEDNCHPAFRKQLLRHSSPSSCLFSLFFSSSSMFHRPWDGRWCRSPI